MIVRKVIIIHLKEGVTAKLLLTPALYGIAKERGIEIFSAPTEKEDTRSLEQYVKIAYCAAILAWEVGAVDDPDQGEFPYTFEDFHLWSFDNPRDFGKAIDAILIALTGKSARQYIREAEQATDEKKKDRPEQEVEPVPLDYGKIETFLVGRCGLTQVQAAQTSMTELRHLVEEANKQTQERWEIARWERWHALQLSPDIKPFNKPATPKAMMRFPWEEPDVEITKEDCHISPEAEQALNDIVADFYARRNASQSS